MNGVKRDCESPRREMTSVFDMLLNATSCPVQKIAGSRAVIPADLRYIRRGKFVLTDYRIIGL